MLIGKKLKAKRTEKNFSADYIAEKVGIDISTYRKYERDDVSPNLEKLKKIADALETPFLSLIESPEQDIDIIDNKARLYNYTLKLSQKAIEQYEEQIKDLKEDKEYLRKEIITLKMEIKSLEKIR